ncbi:hypothetical protein ECG_06187 [Echinococcus granulosus]|nr:hypothetical protein ECG_06187 [Echinococcus granulosus]
MLVHNLKEVRLPPISNPRGQFRNIFFTISSQAGNAIIYRSHSCTDFNNPIWTVSGVFSSYCSQQTSQVYVFRFYLVANTDQRNFVMTLSVNFSAFYSLFPDSQFPEQPNDRIILRFDGYYFAEHLRDVDINSAFLPIKTSYTLIQLKQILYLAQKIELAKSRYAELQEDFCTFLEEQREATETVDKMNTTYVRISTLRNRIHSLNKKISSLNSRVESINSQKAELDKEEDRLLVLSEACSQKMARIGSCLRTKKLELTKMLQLCNLRRFHMLYEVATFYPIEVVGATSAAGKTPPNPSNYLLTICGLLLLEGDAPGTTTSTAPASWIDVGNGMLIHKKPSCLIQDDGEEGQRLSQSLRGLLLTNRMPTACAALLHIVCLLRLFSTILNVPLRYPMEEASSNPSDAFRPRILDPFMVNRFGGSFPLYAQRNNAGYRYAVVLLNRNIVNLRAFFNLSTSNTRAALWNIKNLLEARLLYIDSGQRLPKEDRKEKVKET